MTPSVVQTGDSVAESVLSRWPRWERQLGNLETERDVEVGRNELGHATDRRTSAQGSWEANLTWARAAASVSAVALPGAHYDAWVSGPSLPGGVVHQLPNDLREALLANAVALDAWSDITPLARNEFICWVEDAKQKTTRARRIRRTQEELEEGQRRPCCWPGCRHRDRTGK